MFNNLPVYCVVVREQYTNVLVCSSNAFKVFPNEVILLLPRLEKERLECSHDFKHSEASITSSAKQFL